MQDSQHQPAGNAQPVEGKKKRKWPWIVGGLLVVGLIGSALGGGDETGDTAAEDTTTATEQEAPAEDTTGQAPEETSTEEQQPVGDGDVGAEYEQWYLSNYDTPTWEHVCGTYGGWACNVTAMRTMDGNDTIVIVTNLSQDNPEGVELANNAAGAVKNQAGIDPTIPQSVKDNAKYVQVWDMQGNVLANDSVEFVD